MKSTQKGYKENVYFILNLKWKLQTITNLINIFKNALLHNKLEIIS